MNKAGIRIRFPSAAAIRIFKRKESVMKKYMTKSTSPQVSTPQLKTTQVSVPQPVYDISRTRPESPQAATPTHEDIARRAYEIYLEKGSPQGQSEQIWQQAEQEQLNRRLTRFLSK
jgi:hypothetical protein